VLLWYSFAGVIGMPAKVPMYGISTKGGNSGKRERDRSTMALNEDISKSLTESMRTRVALSWLATREVLVAGSAAPPPVYAGPPADSSALRVTAISAADAVLRLRGMAEIARRSSPYKAPATSGFSRRHWHSSTRAMKLHAPGASMMPWIQRR
jgi:hypothetical protein